MGGHIVDGKFQSDKFEWCRLPLVHLCFACQSSMSSETRPALVPMPVCARCGEPCISGCWIVRESP